MKKGIDVSAWQGNINWAQAKTDEHVEFAILRAGVGKFVNQKDKQFEANYSGCKANDIPCGIYWYSYATTVEDAKKEAAVCLKVIEGKSFEYPIYYDIEEAKQFALGKDKCTELAKAFLDTVEKAGYWVGLYMSRSPLTSYIDESVRKRYAIWIAEYTSNDKPNYTDAFGVWQHGIAGDAKYDYRKKKNIAGIKGACDLNYCYVDYPTLIKSKGLNGFKKTAVPEKVTEKVEVKPVVTPVKPVTVVKPVTPSEPVYNTYTVQQGDTLWGIAVKYLGRGSRYTEIKILNGLKSDTIYKGQKLKIPKK